MGIRAVYQCVFFYVYLHSDDNNDDDESKFWVFDFYETFICYGGCLNLNCYISKKVQKKFSYGFKNLVKLGVEIINFKITIGRTVFNFSCKTSVFARLGALFGQFLSYYICLTHFCPDKRTCHDICVQNMAVLIAKCNYYYYNVITIK